MHQLLVCDSCLVKQSPAIDRLTSCIAEFGRPSSDLTAAWSLESVLPRWACLRECHLSSGLEQGSDILARCWDFASTAGRPTSVEPLGTDVESTWC